MSMKHLVLSAVLLAGTCAMAESPVRFGVTVQGGVPLSDLDTFMASNPCVGVGIQATLDLSKSVALRGRLDYNHYADADVNFVTFQQRFTNVDVYHAKDKTNALELALDYMYFVDGKDKGLYLVFGPSAIQWDMRVDVSGQSVEEKTTKLGLNAGIGYQIDHNLSVEARYTYSSVSSDFAAPSLMISLNYRF